MTGKEYLFSLFQVGLEQKLLNSNASRTFYTQKLLPGAGVVLEMFESKEKAVAAKDMVRTDSNLQKLDRFMTRESKDGVKEAEAGVVEAAKEEVEDVEMEVVGRAAELSSVRELRQQIAEEVSPECRTILAGHTFVGCVDRRLALVQHSTKLYLTNTTSLTKHLFRQLLLRDFGRLGVLRLCPPPSVQELALLALEQEEAGWREEDGSKEELARHVEDTLAGRTAMLADYFSLHLEEVEGRLVVAGVPALLEGYCPWWSRLPLYILRLATEVHWADEKLCFDTLVRETADFYCVCNREGARFDTGQHAGLELDWEQTVEHVVYPALKSLLLPPRSCLTDRSILQVANLPDLYKVFERC